MSFWYWFTHLLYLSKWELMNVPIWYQIVASLIILSTIALILGISYISYLIYKKLKEKK